MIYADSSFLVSAFGSDANSEEAVNLLAAAEEPLAMISLHRPARPAIADDHSALAQGRAA